MGKKKMKSAPDCEADDMKAMMEKELDDTVEKMSHDLKNLPGMDEAAAKEQAKAEMDAAFDDVTRSVAAESLKDATKGDSATPSGDPKKAAPPVVPAPSPTSGSGALAMSLGAVVVALVGLVQI